MTDDTAVTKEKALKQRLKKEGVELVRFIAGAAVVYLAITTLLFRTFYIPSSSMEPTLEVGDRVIVLNFMYGWSRQSLPFGLGDHLPSGDGRILGRLPARGDVAVFRHPACDPSRPRATNRCEHLIKRVIGLPGDEIEMRAGRLYLNGELVERDLVDIVRYRTYDTREIVNPQLFEESLPGGKVHKIYERSDSNPLDDGLQFVVPAHHVFVMGDNRDMSRDSRDRRSLGFVPTEQMVGKAMTVLFTFKSCRKEATLECPNTWDRWMKPL